jgi:hypothetical protein
MGHTGFCSVYNPCHHAVVRGLGGVAGWRGGAARGGAVQPRAAPRGVVLLLRCFVCVGDVVGGRHTYKKKNKQEKKSEQEEKEEGNRGGKVFSFFRYSASAPRAVRRRRRRVERSLRVRRRLQSVLGRARSRVER